MHMREFAFREETLAVAIDEGERFLGYTFRYADNSIRCALVVVLVLHFDGALP